MSLINCPECNHLMSETASICPNCNKPRNAEKFKNCTNCGNEIGFRRKKCPDCKTIQTNNLKSNSMTSPTSKNQPSNLFIYFLIFVLGGVLMFLTYPYIQDNPEIVYDREDAKVNKINGLYVYVEASPKNKDSYTVIGSVEGDNIIEMAQSLGIGREKAGKVIENIFNLGSKNINFHQQLITIIDKVKEQFPDAQGVIFTNKIKRCEVIIFGN